MLLSQWNRTTSSNYDATPTAQGLWGSMVLEASADCIWGVDHSRFERADDALKSRSFLACLKNRHGPSGISVPIEMDFTTLRIRDVILEEEPYDWPK